VACNPRFVSRIGLQQDAKKPYIVEAETALFLKVFNFTHLSTLWRFALYCL